MVAIRLIAFIVIDRAGAAVPAEQFPLVPISGVNLIGDEYSGIQQDLKS